MKQTEASPGRDRSRGLASRGRGLISPGSSVDYNLSRWRRITYRKFATIPVRADIRYATMQKLSASPHCWAFHAHFNPTIPGGLGPHLRTSYLAEPWGSLVPC